MHGTHDEVVGVHLVGEHSPGTISTRRSWMASPSGGTIVNLVPTANGPSESIFSILSFHPGQPARSHE